MLVTLKRTALYDLHVELGAKITEFGGWEMPLCYPSGTIKEHIATRTDAAIFDVSHLGTVELSGQDAYSYLQSNLTNNLDKISVGKAQYTHLLDEDGSVLDDIIIWWTEKDSFDVMPNASNTTNLLNFLPGKDITATRTVIALQGPNYESVINKVIPQILPIAHFEVKIATWNDVLIKVAGTGYTGENGVELAIPNSLAKEMWQQLMQAGALPAGLGARDTLRLEAGLPLHGHELGPGITPLQAGLGWVVALDKGDFRGKAALLEQKSHPATLKLAGILGTSRRPFRDGQQLEAQGEAVGTITSGGYSPMLKNGIALAYVSHHLDVGQQVEVDSHGSKNSGQIVPLPFVKKSYQTGKHRLV